MKVKSIGLALAVAGLGVLQQISVAQALTWNWSYSGNGINASGTWVSDGSTYNQSTLYTIQSISGTRNGVSITGLSTGLQGNNKFEWNGTNIITNNQGFDYTVASSSSPNEFSGVCDACTINTYQPVDNEYYQDANGFDQRTNPVTSSLTPAAAVPWDFSPTLGLALGVPLFMGLRIRKKRLALKRRTSQAVTAEAEGACSESAIAQRDRSVIA
jgi:hypothetical protein